MLNGIGVKALQWGDPFFLDIQGLAYRAYAAINRAAALSAKGEPSERIDICRCNFVRFDIDDGGRSIF